MNLSLDHILLTPEEMAAADVASARSGIPSFDLMERAGQAVAAAALKHFPGALRFVVLCGPGNNGGDGYVAARVLAEAGAAVAIFHMGDPGKLKGDAEQARGLCRLPSAPLENYRPQTGDVIVDALFGAGLTRAVPDIVSGVIRAAHDLDIPVLAVDLPSGLCGRRGVPLGAAFRARHTITFMTRKPGHLLLPGRALCGYVEVFDIGIPARIVHSVAGKIRENAPALWQGLLPEPAGDTHKYRRGHLAVFCGPAGRTGAARLSAMAGLKAGAGLVTVASPGDAMPVNASSLTAVMLHQVDTVGDLESWLGTAKLAAFVLGPGFGIGEKARKFALALKDRPLVLDADGITSFKDNPQQLFDAFAGGETRLVLTPHEGEFSRLFSDLAADENLGKVEKAAKAAERAHAAIVYKGADTVIASPDGRACINANGPPWLATAGSGDVLSGMIGALLAQGMPAFEAAAAGVYLHGEAARRAGRGMTAEDLAAHAGVGIDA
ncbi:NAD(P)H-hydrate dehydratase [Neorhizobium petrolearium]|uniref:NAD(P)H-hydrate dehydratase n=1 Tax=Neorhizobium petrolearium TaxID=515361 RepID=UPI003F13CDDD